ncbi:UPF0184 protein CG14818 [Contarinia nasturtii]|uniref:UPF0184 protein CG14818 n=1 Tax=Contarinia nasturtii TaxID=265458 RepID=UPI0012D468BD|nr:UPF0184 protein CG14818 [Contarinia nasturtii]
MAEHGDIQEINQEQELKDQLEKICLDYQSLVNNSREMAPKGTNTKKTPDANAENSIDDDDLEEIANVADNLDSLESALDMIEERADRIREQLLELLTSNREIRQSIKEENDKLREGQSQESSDVSNSSEANNEQTNDDNNH